MTEAPTKRLPTVQAVVVMATLGVGALLCFHDLGARPLWLDEGWGVAVAKLSWGGLLYLGLTQPVQWPYYLVLRAWLVFGNTEAIIRTPSALFMIASIPLMFLVGRRLFGATAGLACAALFAVNADIIKYAHEARGYSMEVFLLALSLYCLCRYVDNPSTGARIAYIAVCSLAIYVHIYGLLVVAAQAVSLLMLPRPTAARKHLIANYFLIALINVPMWIFALRMPSSYTDWMPMPTGQVVYDVLQHVCGNGGGLLVLLYAVVGIASLVSFAFLLRTTGLSRSAWAAVLPALCFSVPFLVTIAVSHFARPCFMGRYMLFSIPGLVLMIGTLVPSLPRPWIALPLVALFAAVSLDGVRAYYRADYDRPPEDYPTLAQLIARQTQPGDAITFSWPGMYGPYGYYMGRLQKSGTAPALICPALEKGFEPFQLSLNEEEMRRSCPVEGYRRVWVVLHNPPGNSPDASALRVVRAAERHYSIANVWEFPSWTVLLYVQRSQVSM